MNLIGFFIIIIIGMGITLAVMTIKFLVDQKRRGKSDLHRINGLYIYILCSIVVSVLFVLKEVSRGATITLANKNNLAITINKNIERIRSVDLNTNDSNNFYFDEQEGFSFRIPQTIGWNKPTKISGLGAYMEKVAFETNMNSIESFLKSRVNSELLECIFNDPGIKPVYDIHSCVGKQISNGMLGRLLSACHSTSVKHGITTVIDIREKSSTPIDEFFTDNDSTVSDSVSFVSNESGDQYVSSLSYVNYFNVTVINKEQIEELQNQFTLANYFVSSASYLTDNIENIIADEKNWLFTANLEFNDVKIADTTSDFIINRWVRMIDDNGKLYVIEMAYSPETDKDGELWKDLKATFESFKLVISTTSI